MSNKVIRALTAKAGERNTLSFYHSSRNVLWVSFALIFIFTGSIGCSGPTQQVLPPQALSPNMPNMPAAATDASNKQLQQQLMTQASQAALVNYRDYQVGPEDLLVIVIYGQEKLNRELRVNGQGEITMPLVGVVQVGGLTPQEIEKKLGKLYDARFLVDPQVTVEVKEFRHQRVAVTGAVAKPGAYEIIGPRTLLEVLALAGGFSGAASGDVVNVIRNQNAADLTKIAKNSPGNKMPPKKEIMVVDLRRLVSGQDPRLNIMVQNGDVVDVPFAGSAYVLGAVRKPGNILVKENLTVTQAISLAGGIDPILGTNSITIMRVDEKGKPVNIDTNYSSIISRNDPDLSIKNNDVIVVNESSVKKALYVIRSLIPIPSFPAF